jgi:hypothetical protein
LLVVGCRLFSWGNYKPKWWSQGSSFSSSKTKSEHTRQKEVDSTGWWYMFTCELDLLCTAVANLFAGGNKKMARVEKINKIKYLLF